MPAPGNGPQVETPGRGLPPVRTLARWTGVAVAGLSAAVVIAAIVFALLLNSVTPNIPRSDLYALNRPASLKFVDENDQPVGLRGARLGQRLTLSEMPPYLPEAFVAAEDRHFYQHHGIDPEGMLRAAIVNFKAGHVVEGGSTITQQLVKMLFLTPDRTMSRKLHEMAG